MLNKIKKVLKKSFTGNKVTNKDTKFIFSQLIIAPTLYFYINSRVCKTLIHQFKSGRHLQKIPGC